MYNYLVGSEDQNTSAAKVCYPISIQATGPQHREAVWFHIRKWEILKTIKDARKY